MNKHIRFFVCDQWTAEHPNRKLAELMTSYRHVWISITEPGDPTAKLFSMHPNCRDVLRLSFHDVNKKYDDHARPILPMTRKQARQVVAFMEKHKDLVDYCFVHCYAGVSRSVSVARALREIYGRPTIIFNWMAYYLVKDEWANNVGNKCSQEED